MQITKLMTDEDRAVSPVIGVILMVAITVILAAVIASFVLGLGGTSDPAPTPTLEWSQDTTEEEVEISVTGGDTFEAGNMDVVVDLEDESGNTDRVRESWADKQSPGEVSAGDSLTLELNDKVTTLNADADSELDVGDETEYDWEVTLIWETADTDPEIITSEDGTFEYDEP